MTGSAGRKDLELFAGIDELDQGHVVVQRPAKDRKNTEKRKRLETPQLVEKNNEIDS
jgi:hypothetical protein